MPDFTLGGGRYTQLLNSIRRGSKVNRNAPVTLEMLNSIAALQHIDDPKSAGIACAALVGFFFLLGVGELEGLRWMDASLSADSDGDVCMRLELPRSKTDQRNEGHIKRLGRTNRPLCPVRIMGKRVGIHPGNRIVDYAPVFSRDLRQSIARALKLSAVSA